MRAIVSALLALSLSASAAATGPELCVSPGDPFPDLSFPHLLAPSDYETLGIPEGPFRLNEIRSDLLVLEFFNKFCLTCWRQAPQLQTFSELLKPGDLDGRVRVLSIAAGNDDRELQEFRDEFDLSIPLAADPNFEQFYALGDPGGTPCTAFLLRRDDRWVLADFHVGFYGDVELLARARTLLRGWSAPPRGTTDRGEVSASVPEDEGARTGAFLSRVLGRTVETQLVTLPAGVRLWRAREADGSLLDVYARVAAREPVCDLCHTIHFLFAFDGRGRIRGFEPIYVTKFGNALWSPDDALRLEGRLQGRQVDDLPFDPRVDAVTSATMSSALVFDEVRRAARYLRDLP